MGVVDTTGDNEYEGLTRCLFCHRPLERNEHLRCLPFGTRFAYDPAAGRLWVVCRSCRGWNLCPMEARHGALSELERLVRDRARLLARTANIAMYEARGISVVRVGAAELVERAWWRYGRELRRRKSAASSRRSTVAAYTLGAMAYVGEVLGLGDPDLSIDWHDAPVLDVLRWRRFGWAAWHGRETCPYCRSTLRALRYDLGWWVYPLSGPEGRLSVGVPCQRCDPWTPEKVYELHGDVAENVLRRLLAYQNLGGASEGDIRAAAAEIERAGSAQAFQSHLTSSRASLWKMGTLGTVALEIALSESAERRLLEMELRAVRFLWKREEELARIIDEELTPPELWRSYARKLPVGPAEVRGPAEARTHPSRG